MEFAAINSPAAAFVAGLVTSLHCAGMCGPLACGLMPVRGDRADPQTVSTVYHLSRLASYAALGAVAGSLGASPLTWLSPIRAALPPVGDGAVFRRARPSLGPFPAEIRGDARAHCTAAGFPPPALTRGSGRGARLRHPALPCGPLYFLISLALLSGSALRGVEFMLAFGLGTVPLLWLAQTQFAWVRQALPPIWLGRVRTALALTTAVVIGWRLRVTLGFEGPDPASLVCR
jgi:sulfite exporter TauE/SafE